MKNSDPIIPTLFLLSSPTIQLGGSSHIQIFVSFMSFLCKQVLLKVHNSHRIRIIFMITKATSSLSSVALTECQSCLKHTGALLQSGRNVHAPSQTIRQFQLITTHAEARF